MLISGDAPNNICDKKAIVESRTYCSFGMDSLFSEAYNGK
jgi:hypothetical protein